MPRVDGSVDNYRRLEHAARLWIEEVEEEAEAGGHLSGNRPPIVCPLRLRLCATFDCQPFIFCVCVVVWLKINTRKDMAGNSFCVQLSLPPAPRHADRKSKCRRNSVRISLAHEKFTFE